MNESKRTRAAVCALVAVLIALIAVGAAYYYKVYVPSFEQAAQEQTSYAPKKNTPKKAGKRELVASDSGNATQLYKDGDYVILVQNGRETEFSGWAEGFGSIETHVYSADYNKDGISDIIVTDTEGKDGETGSLLMGFYVLESQNGGRDGYRVNYTNSADWKNLFDSIVDSFLNQPQAYPGHLQFAMDYNGESFSVDSDTGLVPEGHKAWYINVPRGESGGYYTLESMDMGPAVIEYDAQAHSATAYIDVYAVYEGGEKQLIGRVSSGLDLAEDGFTIRTKSVLFEPEDALEARAPQR